jgi:hypothetical protein
MSRATVRDRDAERALAAALAVRGMMGEVWAI